MKIARGEVLVLKASSDYTDDEEDPYKKKLEDAGIHSYKIPVLDFEYCNLNVLHQNLQNPDKFSGLIFTSPRAIKAVTFLEDVHNLVERWQHHPVFVVGEGSLATLKKELNLEGQGSVAGSASALAHIILQNKYESPLLFPCGNLKHDELPSKLSEGGVSLVAVTVYQTQVHRELERRLWNLTAQSSSFPEIVVYFSPSGVKFTVPILQKLGVPLEKLKFVAIGPTTEAAILGSKLTVWSVATKPTPEHLLSAVIKC